MVASTKIKRSLVGGLWDRLAGYFYKLPSEQNSYTITPVSIPLRDSTSLAGDLYEPILPSGSRPVGTVLHFTPYGRTLLASTGLRPLAPRGYQVLNNTVQDIHDTAKWMREQDWYTDSFATVGASFIAFNAWALMLDPPPDMAAAISVVGPHDMSRYFWETGAPSLDVLPWTDLLLNTGEGDLFSPFYRIMTVNKRMRHVYDAVPLLPAIEQYFEGRAPWLREQLTRHDLRDKYWDSMQYGSALDRATVPILVSSGWRDFFIVQALEQYARLSERGVNVALTIGPWIHHQVNAATHKDTFAWLEKHLADRTENRRPRGPVQVFVTGTGKDKDDQGVWCHLPKWPPATTPFEFYLLSAGKLATTASPAHTEPTSTSFTFDPASPTPAVAGPFSDGAISDEVLAARGDVVMFTSDPLENDLELLGAAAVELAHTSDNPHIDLYLRLSEVRDNKARIIADAYRRLDPKRDPTELVQLSLHPCAHHFRKGGQIRLLVAGGQHPKYMRNLGTDESPISGATMRKATHTIYYNVKKVSRVILPVGEITRKFGHIDL